MTDDLLAAYRATRVELLLPSGPCVLPAADEPPLATLPPELASETWILTAWNPASRPLDPEDNARRNIDLAASLRTLGCRWWPAEGRARDGDWAEASLAVADLPAKEALRLGALFGQHAIFRLGTDGLHVVPITPTRSSSTCRARESDQQRQTAWRLADG